MATWNDIKKANETIKTTGLERKDKTGKVTVTEYAEVNQRIKAFRMVYPDGYIGTDIVSLTDGVCIMRAHVGCYDESGKQVLLATGTAYEKENSSFINKTSYIENCETSAVGRALGMAGFGIDTSIVSFEEASNAIANQKEQIEVRKATPKQVDVLKERYTGANLTKLLKAQGITQIEDISMEAASSIISKLNNELQVKPMMEGK